jgi:hypothetical protein
MVWPVPLLLFNRPYFKCSVDFTELSVSLTQYTKQRDYFQAGDQPRRKNTISENFATSDLFEAFWPPMWLFPGV